MPLITKDTAYEVIRAKIVRIDHRFIIHHAHSVADTLSFEVPDLVEGISSVIIFTILNGELITESNIRLLNFQLFLEFVDHGLGFTLLKRLRLLFFVF